MKEKIKTVLFDFDGTISTLRCGWEAVMEPMMLEMIAGDTEIDQALTDEVRAYIDESTGIQTIFQMMWLAEAVRRHGRSPAVRDPWDYKAEYNRRLMLEVERRKRSLAEGRARPADYLIAGSAEFLEALRRRGVHMLLASGTDDRDVREESALLGVAGYFQSISGAPDGRADCPKTAAIRALLRGIPANGLCVVGDGKVEIALGAENGARTLGIASDEANRRGVNPAKVERLSKAGAELIVGDFTGLGEILEFLGY